MRKIILILILNFCFTQLFSQYKITGRIVNYNNNDVALCSQFGEESKLIKKTKTDKDGGFNIDISNFEKGLYRIYLENKEYFDFIIAEEDFEFSTNINNPKQTILILKSNENTQLYKYFHESYKSEYKINILKELLNIYPEGKFYKNIEKELFKEENIRNKNIDKILLENPNSFAARYIRYFKNIVTPKNLDDYAKTEFLRKNYLQNFNFEDSEIINSDAYTHIVIEYLKLYKSKNQEVHYNAAKQLLDFIITKDTKVFNYIFEYLLSGYEDSGFDNLVSRLSLEYGNLCTSDNESLSIRLNNYTKLAIGEKAPDFDAITIKGDSICLSNMTTEYCLIIFFASWCDHCREMIPNLIKAESVFKEANMQIIGISLDTDTKALKGIIEKYEIPWNIICDYKGWDGNIAIDYSIFASPSMFILDKELKIIAKPLREEKLVSILKNVILQKR